MKTQITVQNLRCGGCANTITKKLSVINDVKDISIAIEASQISFETEHKDTIGKVIEQLKVLGYPEETKHNSLASKAKSFVSCATGKLSS